MKMNAAETYVAVCGLKLLLQSEQAGNDASLRRQAERTLKRLWRSHQVLARLEGWDSWGNSAKHDNALARLIDSAIASAEEAN